MAIIGTIIGAIFGIAVLEVILSALFLMIGAKVAKIENATFGRSVLASLGAALVTWIIAIVFSILPVIGTVIGFLLGVLLSLFVIKGVFSTTIQKAFLAWVFNILAKIIAIVIAIMTFASALLTMFQ